MGVLKAYIAEAKKLSKSSQEITAGPNVGRLDTPVVGESVAIHVKKGAFHRWLGKSPDAKITAADVAKGKAAGGHAAKMATFAQNFGHIGEEYEPTHTNFDDWKKDVESKGHKIKAVTKSRNNTYYQAWSKDKRLVGHFNTGQGTHGKSSTVVPGGRLHEEFLDEQIKKGDKVKIRDASHHLYGKTGTVRVANSKERNFNYGKVTHIVDVEGKPYRVETNAVGKLHETLAPDARASDYIDDFVHSNNKMFKGDSKKQRIKRALGAYYGSKNESLSEMEHNVVKHTDAATWHKHAEALGLSLHSGEGHITARNKAGGIHGVWHGGANKGWMHHIAVEEIEEFEALVENRIPKDHTIEAYGVKGIKSKQWQKTFKHAEHLNKWAEDNDADIHGTRDLEQHERGNLSTGVAEETINEAHKVLGVSKDEYGNRYELRAHNSGHESEWHGIIKTHQHGEKLDIPHSASTVGKPKYVAGKWKALQAQNQNPKISYPGVKKMGQVKEETIAEAGNNPNHDSASIHMKNKLKRSVRRHLNSKKK